MDWGDDDGVAVVGEDHVDVGLPEHGADAEHGIDAEHDVDAENDADAEDDADAEREEPENGGAGCARPLASVLQRTRLARRVVARRSSSFSQDRQVLTVGAMSRTDE